MCSKITRLPRRRCRLPVPAVEPWAGGGFLPRSASPSCLWAAAPLTGCWPFPRVPPCAPCLVPFGFHLRSRRTSCRSLCASSAQGVPRFRTCVLRPLFLVSVPLPENFGQLRFCPRGRRGSVCLLTFLLSPVQALDRGVPRLFLRVRCPSLQPRSAPLLFVFHSPPSHSF